MTSIEKFIVETSGWIGRRGTESAASFRASDKSTAKILAYWLEGSTLLLITAGFTAAICIGALMTILLFASLMAFTLSARAIKWQFCGEYTTAKGLSMLALLMLVLLWIAQVLA